MLEGAMPRCLRLGSCLQGRRGGQLMILGELCSFDYRRAQVLQCRQITRKLLPKCATFWHYLRLLLWGRGVTRMTGKDARGKDDYIPQWQDRMYSLAGVALIRSFCAFCASTLGLCVSPVVFFFDSYHQSCGWSMFCRHLSAPSLSFLFSCTIV